MICLLIHVRAATGKDCYLILRDLALSSALWSANNQAIPDPCAVLRSPFPSFVLFTSNVLPGHIRSKVSLGIPNIWSMTALVSAVTRLSQKTYRSLPAWSPACLGHINQTALDHRPKFGTWSRSWAAVSCGRLFCLRYIAILCSGLIFSDAMIVPLVRGSIYLQISSPGEVLRGTHQLKGPWMIPKIRSHNVPATLF